MNFDPTITNLAKDIIELCSDKKLEISIAESCTGGLMAGALTEIQGASKVFTHGFITYSNHAKQNLLGVKSSSLENFGAVSQKVVKEMALGALRKSKGDIAIAVSGVAGPDGSKSKPVGLVFIGLAIKSGQTTSHVFKFGTIGRSQVRIKTIKVGLQLVLNELSD